MSQAGTLNGTGGGGGSTSNIQNIIVQTGTSPVVTTNNTITFNGAVVASGSNPVRTDGTAPATMALEVQISQAIASTDSTKIGLAAFNSADFTVDANGFVSSAGGGSGITTIDGDTGSVTGTTITIETLPATNGGTVIFSGSGTTLTLIPSDSNSSTGFGFQSLNSTTSTGTNNTAFGTQALGVNDTGSNNTGIGSVALAANLGGSGNNAFGNYSLSANTTGSFNTGFGYAALLSNLSGSNNIGIGTAALQHGTNSSNTAIGYFSLNTLIGGSNNIAIGYNSGISYVGSESSNLLIGNSGVVSESNVIRIGTQGSSSGQQNECFVAGITGVTTSNSNFVTIDTTTGQLGATSGSGSTYFSITPYIVGADIHSEFSTIQAAITQAIADGASTSTPKNIYIKPGTYTENLTGNDGIRLIGLSIVSSGLIGSPQAGSVIWDGTLTWSSGQMSFENIRAAYSGSSTVITVPASGNFTAIGCQFVGFTGTYFGTSGDNVSININDCYASTANLFDSANSNVSFNANGGFTDGILSGTGFSCNFSNLTFNGSVVVTAGVSSTGTAGFTNCTITSANPFDASAAIFTSSVLFSECYIQISGTLILQQFGSFAITSCNGTVNTLLDTSSHTTGSAPGGTVFNSSLQESVTSSLGVNTILALINCDGINPPTLASGAIVEYFNTLSGSASQNVSTIINNQAISTSASDGFLYIPSCNGAPIGTPTTYGSAVPIIMDTSTNQLYGYTSGSWQVI